MKRQYTQEISHLEDDLDIAKAQATACEELKRKMEQFKKKVESFESLKANTREKDKKIEKLQRDISDRDIKVIVGRCPNRQEFFLLFGDTTSFFSSFVGGGSDENTQNKDEKKKKDLSKSILASFILGSRSKVHAKRLFRWTPVSKSHSDKVSVYFGAYSIFHNVQTSNDPIVALPCLAFAFAFCI